MTTCSGTVRMLTNMIAAVMRAQNKRRTGKFRYGFALLSAEHPAGGRAWKIVTSGGECVWLTGRLARELEATTTWLWGSTMCMASPKEPAQPECDDEPVRSLAVTLQVAPQAGAPDRFTLIDHRFDARSARQTPVFAALARLTGWPR